MTDISEMIGKTPIRIEGAEGSTEVKFWCSDGSAFALYFEDENTGNDASVRLEDLGGGSLQSLIGHPIIAADMSSGSAGEDEESGNHATWTFVRLRSHGGDVTMRWYGRSNGYYSESPFVRRWQE